MGSDIDNWLLTAQSDFVIGIRMARKPRIQFSGAFYHVFARGNHRQEIFHDEDDFQQYLKRLISYQQRYHFTLYAYVLMPNHVHLLLEQGETPLSKIMQGLQQSFTLYYNKRYGKSGHLFQGRYKAILCDRDAYLLELVRYIHLNSVRAGIVKRPEDYPWSSHRKYLTGRSLPWLDVEMLLGMLAETKKKALSRYRDFIHAVLDNGSAEDFYQVREQRYLGDDRFVAKTEKRLSSESPRDFPVELDLKHLLDLISNVFEVPVARIMDHTRSRDAALCRAVTAYLAREVGDIPLKNVAEYFKRDSSSLSQGLRKVALRLNRDREFAKKLGRVVKEVRRR